MSGPSISRRALLGASGALGAGALLSVPALGLGATAFAQTDDDPAPTPSDQSAINIFEDPDINFQMLFALGAIGTSMAEYGEVASVIDAVLAAGSTYDAIFDQFTAQARRLAAKAESNRDANHRITARAQFLRAARYLTPPLFFALGTSNPSKQAQAAAYRELKSTWDAAAALFDPIIAAVRIPYGRSTLPGWFLTPSSTGSARPTVILNNGNDAQMADIYSYGGTAAVERGYNALIFEGPGQGGNLFLKDIPFRPDWDKVITPVVDFLVGRTDVDAEKIAIIGWSEGGELVAQALTKEHRIAAGVVDPGILDEMGSFAAIPQGLISLVNEGKKREVNEEWDSIFPTLPESTQFTYTKSSMPFGQDNFYDNIKKIQEFKLTPEQIGTIDNAMLVTQYEGEQFYAGQAQQVYDSLKSERELVTFTTAEGAQLHDAPMAPQTRNEVVFDWLDDQLG